MLLYKVVLILMISCSCLLVLGAHLLRRPAAIRRASRATVLYSWLMISLGAAGFVIGLYSPSLSFADSCLLASAMFLYIGGVNPLLFALVVKARLTEELNGVERAERAVNLTALLAVLLAVAWGLTGAVVYAQENKERTQKSEELTAKVEYLEKTVHDQEEAVSSLRKVIEQGIRDSLERNAKNEGDIGSIGRIASAAGTELLQVADSIRKLKAGDAQDARVNDLLSSKICWSRPSMNRPRNWQTMTRKPL
jgi:apolipoprotein N-acyltransferase